MKRLNHISKEKGLQMGRRKPLAPPSWVSVLTGAEARRLLCLPVSKPLSLPTPVFKRRRIVRYHFKA